jgi:acetyl-CoA carboxylase biotin carboxyl carrier protein
VADEAPNNPRPFNVRTIKFLVALMDQNDLSEIDLREGDQRIRLLRGPRGTVALAAPTSVPAAAVAAPPPAAAPTAPAPAKPDKQLVPIKSPTPGTFYAKPNPDSEPFVRVGARVTPTTVVCIIEAMKIFNEITADCNGVVTEILAENQQPVEYGQVLFRVDPAG